MNSNNIQFQTIEEYIYNWLLDQITWNRQWHACSQCQLGDNHQLHCYRLKRMWDRNETHLHRDQILKCAWFYACRQVNLMVVYSVECFSWAIVDVQCLCLIWVGVTLGNSQPIIISPLLRCLFEWGWGTTGVRSPAYWGGWYQGCQRECCTGLAPWYVMHSAVGGVVWTNGEHKNNRWQVSASEWWAKITDGK